jgi:hypothetical protein
MSPDQPQNNGLPRDKAEVLARIAHSRATLEAALGGLRQEQLTDSTDAQGWTVKDHLTHLAAWERLMAYLLRGQARHEGLGIPEATYRRAGVDAINAAIRDQYRDRSLDGAMALFHDAHRQLLAALEPLSYDDLLRPRSHFLPGEPGDDDGRPILAGVLHNTAEHYVEHLAWIEALTM